jgi:hypothetical protein
VSNTLAKFTLPKFTLAKFGALPKIGIVCGIEPEIIELTWLSTKICVWERTEVST